LKDGESRLRQAQVEVGETISGMGTVGTMIYDTIHWEYDSQTLNTILPVVTSKRIIKLIALRMDTQIQIQVSKRAQGTL
jgi:hypothetical protein